MRDGRVFEICFAQLVAMIWFLGAGAAAAEAQSFDPLEDVGIRPLSAQLPIENGLINTANGNVHIEIPLGSFTQRGGRQATFALVYDSGIWSQDGCCSWLLSYTGFAYGTQSHFVPGWKYVVSQSPGVTNSDFNQHVCSVDGRIEWISYNSFIWTDPGGTTHLFPIYTAVGYVTRCGDFTAHNLSTGDSMALDGSGYHMYVYGVTYAIVYAPDGTKIIDKLIGGVNQNIDSNGNYFGQNFNGLVDTLGRNPVVQTTTSTNMTFAVLNSQGQRSTYTATFMPISFSTNFASVGSGFMDASSSSGYEEIQSITLPDGTSYSFTYDSGTTLGHYGQLTSMRLPTGGLINYTYTNFVDSMYVSASPHIHVTRGISSRVTPDGTWTYTPQVVIACTSTSKVNCQQKLTVHKPSGDNAVYTTNINGGAYPIKGEYYSGAVSPANLLATQTQTFDYSQPCPPAVTGRTPYLPLNTWPGACYVTKTSESTILPLPGGSTVTKTTNFTWDHTNQIGNLLTKAEWNFYTGSLPATADRTTTFTYLNGAAYLSKNIANKPLTVSVTDKNGSTVAQTVNCYDYSAPCLGPGLCAHHWCGSA